jgi:hypothetical protein
MLTGIASQPHSPKAGLARESRRPIRATILHRDDELRLAGGNVMHACMHPIDIATGDSGARRPTFRCRVSTSGDR